MSEIPTPSAINYDDIMAELQNINESINSSNDFSGILSDLSSMESGLSSQISEVSSEISNLASEITEQFELLGDNYSEQIGVVNDKLDTLTEFFEGISETMYSYCEISLEYQSIGMGILIFFLGCFVIYCVYKLFRIFI